MKMLFEIKRTPWRGNGAQNAFHAKIQKFGGMDWASCVSRTFLSADEYTHQ